MDQAYPEQIYQAVFEITNRCNLRCPHCASDSGVARAEEMSLDQALHVVEDLRKLGCQELALLGGEPFLRPDWYEIAVADWLRDLLCPAKVLKVDKAEITIDMNENEVKEGDLFDVIKSGGVMVNPDSGAAFEIDGKCIGRVVITRPGLQTSKAEPVDGGRLSLERLNVSKYDYKLRRVTKSALMKEAKRRAREASYEH